MRAILFDLDGTIINSEEGITKCVQYALKAYGVDEPDLKKLLCFIGPAFGACLSGKIRDDRAGGMGGG